MSDDMPVMAAREQICHIGRLGAGMWHHTCTETHKELVLKVKRTPLLYYVEVKPRMPTLLVTERMWTMQ